MTKILLSLAVCLAIVSAQATGSLPVNTPQTGVVSYSGTNLIATTTFYPVFSTVPVMTFFGSVTNLLPFTSSITTSNFTLTITTNQSGTTFGGSVAWSAYVGTPQIQSGTISVASTGVTNYAFTFPSPFAYVPVVVASDVGTALANSNDTVTVTAISTTGATITSTGPTTNCWIAIGTSYQPVTGSPPSTSTLPVGK